MEKTSIWDLRRCICNAHGDVKLMPEKKAIYDMFSDNDGAGHLVKCGVKAYVWNAKAFDWNAQFTKQATRSYCRTSQDLSLKQR